MVSLRALRIPLALLVTVAGTSGATEPTVIGTPGTVSAVGPVVSATWDPSQPPPVTVDFELTVIGRPGSVSWDFGDGAVVSGTNQISHTYSTAGLFQVTATLGQMTAQQPVGIHNEILLDDFDDLGFSEDLWLPKSGDSAAFFDLFHAESTGGYEIEIAYTTQDGTGGGSAGKPNIIYTGGDGVTDGEGAPDGFDVPFDTAVDEAFYFAMALRAPSTQAGTWGNPMPLASLRGGSANVGVSFRHANGSPQVRVHHGAVVSAWINVSKPGENRLFLSYEPGAGAQLTVERADGTVIQRSVLTSASGSARGLALGSLSTDYETLPEIDVYLDDVQLYRYGFPSD